MRRIIVLFIFIFLFLFNSAQADLLLYYDFEQVEGDIAVDRSGNSRHGTLTHVNWGDPDWDTPPQYVTSHDSSGAIQFGYSDTGGTGLDGAYNYIQVGYHESLAELGQNWSMAFWCRQDQSGNDPWSGSYFYGPGYGRAISCPNYEIELGAGDIGDPTMYFWPFNADPAWPDPASWDMTMATNPEDTWFHLLVTYDGTTFRQYIDGIEVFTRSTMGSFIENTWDDDFSGTPLRIGAQCDQEKSFVVGRMDDIAIWNETIDANDVNDIKDGTYFLPYKIPVIIGEPEDDTPITYIWDPSFIIRYNNGQVVLGFDEKAPAQMSWNWQMEGTLDDPNYYGLVNAGLWDGDGGTIEYAGFCTVGDNITQVALGRRAFQDIKYDFKARVGGENAVGNIVGVRFYRVDPDEPYGNEVLIRTLSTTIATNQTWVELSDTYTATVDDDNKRFKVVCYTAGPGRGSKFAYFDYVRIDPNEFLTCQARLDYNFGSSGLTNDFNNDCRVNLVDYSVIAGDWASSEPPEPSINDGELLTNSDFYADLYQVPNNGEFVAFTPTGWEFDPPPIDKYDAGIQNQDNNGYVANQAPQPAGGSVAAYIDPNTVLQQAVDSIPILEGETYYVTAMAAGSGGAYLSMVTMTLEYVDNPTSPSTVISVASDTYVLPETLVWRQMAIEYTADSAAAGNYLRIKFDLGPNPFPGATASGYANIGKASITTTKPDTWPRENLLVNGDFEDFTSLPIGTLQEYPPSSGYYYYIDDSSGIVYGWGNVFDYVNRYTQNTPAEPNSIPGWAATGSYYGLQCMLWAPPPQPAMGPAPSPGGLGTGRVSAWFNGTIEQFVPTAMQEDTTYYIDFIACINGTAYQGNKEWPSNGDPNMVIDVFWVATDQNDLSGDPGVDWGPITSVQDPIVGPISGNGTYQDNPFTPWLSVEGSFTADSSLDGKYMYVKAYCDDEGLNQTVDYATFEEIYLSTEPRAQIGPYTCYEQTYTYGITSAEADLNGDCKVDIDDLALFIEENVLEERGWLSCNDPSGCS